MKILVLKLSSCYECPNWDDDGNCMIADNKHPEDPLDSIPDWCPLEEAKE